MLLLQMGIFNITNASNLGRKVTYILAIMSNVKVINRIGNVFTVAWWVRVTPH